MKVIKTIQELRDTLRQSNESWALVPTMGALHQGHLTLVELAKEHSKSVAVSIFVNPTQFNNPSDLQKYPRNLAADLAKLEKQGVSLVFCPQEDEIYRYYQGSQVTPSKLGAVMEGPFRPGHFAGVCTIVSILFNIFQPDYAIFGEKDFQQLRIIETMVQDLKFNLQIVRAPIQREPHGLAHSSRNELLTTEQRQLAANIFLALQAAYKMVKAGATQSSEIILQTAALLKETKDLKIEYLTINQSDTLQLTETLEPGNTYRIFFAGYFGQVRLIDNLELPSL